VLVLKHMRSDLSPLRPKIKRIAMATAITAPITACVLASMLNTAITVVQTGQRSPASSRLSPSSPETNRASGWASTHAYEHRVHDRSGYHDAAQ
jgi:hypothetical protein